MGKLVNNRFLVFLLSTGYLFVTLSHIPFVKRYDPLRANATYAASVFKQQSVANAIGSLKVLFKRIDKHLTKKSKVIGQQIALYSRSLFFLSNARLHEISVQPAVVILNRSYSRASVLCCFRL